MNAQKLSDTYGIVIHGGAGSIRPGSLTPEQEAEYRKVLEQALQAGYDIIYSGGEALDAVEAAISILEDSPLFNAGKGAVFTANGKNELDASIMDGRTRNAGAVAGATRIKNPIKAARKVMDNSPHVLFSGDGANQFAEEQGLEMVDNSYFYTERQWQSLQRIKEKERQQDTSGKSLILDWLDTKYGTVGCAVLDRHGNLAAGTSTGGLTNKSHGRIGDSPIIGAGTWAWNKTCALSCTGQGEYYIRLALAHTVSDLMLYKGYSLEKAMNIAIHDYLDDLGGVGGMIGIDREGHIAMDFNTNGMFRGYIKPGGKPHVYMYKDE